METIRGILVNVILLFGLLLIFGVYDEIYKKNKISFKVFIGVLIGIITVLIMMYSWEMASGAIFDSRSIILALTGLFFAPITTITATILALIYRITLGGIGVYAGVLTILSSSLLGMIWKKYVFKKSKLSLSIQIYLLGLIVHILMLLSQLAFPWPFAFEVLKNISLIVIVVYPLSVLLLGYFLLNQQKRINAFDLITESEARYRSLVENNPLGIFRFNIEGEIIYYNDKFKDIFKITNENNDKINIFNVENETLKLKFLNTLEGNYEVFNDMYKSLSSGDTKPVKFYLSPYYSNDTIVGGIGIIEDLTREYLAKERIEKLTKYDLLTNLLNRESFNAFLMSKHSKNDYPLSLVVCNINTFKIINQTFGFEVGNQLLKAISNIINKNIIDENIAYRIGSDEFAIILKNKEYEEATSYINVIKKQLQDIDEFEFQVNISCGIATNYTEKESLLDCYYNAYNEMQTNQIYDGSSLNTKTIDVLMRTLFTKSARESKHSDRVGRISKKIAESYNLGTAFTNRVALAGKLHDLGKVVISEEILDKPGRLTETEFSKIKTHSEAGFKILSAVPEYLDLANIVLSHHERWDGHGYPKGIEKNNIPLESRIIAVADAYDAMTSYRTYSKPLSREEAIKELLDNSNTQFDQEVVNKFLKLEEIK